MRYRYLPGNPKTRPPTTWRLPDPSILPRCCILAAKIPDTKSTLRLPLWRCPTAFRPIPSVSKSSTSRLPDILLYHLWRLCRVALAFTSGQRWGSSGCRCRPGAPALSRESDGGLWFLFSSRGLPRVALHRSFPARQALGCRVPNSGVAPIVLNPATSPHVPRPSQFSELGPKLAVLVDRNLPDGR